jgi:Domain of unknown function (DUF427)
MHGNSEFRKDQHSGTLLAAPGAVGRFLVPDPRPERLLFAKPLRMRVRVRFGDAWIADSEDVVLLHEPGRYPVAYFPVGDIADGVLEPAEYAAEERALAGQDRLHRRVEAPGRRPGDAPPAQVGRVIAGVRLLCSARLRGWAGPERIADLGTVVWRGGFAGTKCRRPVATLGCPAPLRGAGRRLVAGLVSPRRPARSGIRPRGCRG